MLVLDKVSLTRGGQGADRSAGTGAAGGFQLDANLSVAKGSRVAIMGPSGAGKSTLIEAIAGFTDVPSGSVFWDHCDITNLAPGKRPVAMLFQDGNLFPHLTVAQNVGLGLHGSLRFSAEDKARITTSVARVGLNGLDGRRPAELSGGQQSRAALARVLIQDRPLLLLDEPFSALGPALKAEMLDLVSALATETGATLLMVTHDPLDARRIAQQIVLVSDGKADPPQPTDVLLDNPPPALQAYLG
jgi:thiamine transport system ATP-binding protein